MSEITVLIQGDLSKLSADEATAKEILNELNAGIEETQQKLRTTVRAGLQVISSIVGTMRSVAATFGIAIPPIFDAILSAVTSTVLAMQGIAAAYAAGGITAYLAIPIEAAAIGLSWAGVFWVAMGRQDVDAKLGQAEASLRGIGSTINAIERFTEGF